MTIFHFQNQIMKFSTSIERDKLTKTKSMFFEGPDYDFNTLNHILLDRIDFSKDEGDRKTLKNKSSYLNNLVPSK